MARTAPGDVKAAGCRSLRPTALNRSTRSSPTSRPSWCRASRTGRIRSSSATSPATAISSSVLGDFASTGLGVLGLAWQSSPALTEIEEVATDWLRQMLGLSGAWSGVIQDTASTSTLVALLCARERATNYSLARGGLQAEPAPLVVYASAHSHSSVEKAALLAGFGRDNVRHDRARRRVGDAAGCARAGDRRPTSPPGGCPARSSRRREPRPARRSIRSRRSPLSRGGTASGSTSTRRWPGRR